MGQETVELMRPSSQQPVLVTGANGFLGSWIVRVLVERGYRVRAFVRANADLRNLADCRDRIELATGDILAPDTLDRALQDCDALIHSAGSILTHPRDAECVWQMHYTGTMNTFQAAQRAKLSRIVYTASILTLGVGWRNQPANEEHAQPFNPRHFRYCDAKHATQIDAEKMCTDGLPLVFAYPTYCFGPGDLHLSSQQQLVEYLRGRLPGVTNAGINVIDVRDCALGHVLALERGNIGGKYLLTGRDILFPDLFKRVGEIAGRKRWLPVFPREVLPMVGWLMERILHDPPVDYATAQVAKEFWYYRGDKATRELGLVVRPLDETLRDAIAWFRENRMV